MEYLLLRRRSTQAMKGSITLAISPSFIVSFISPYENNIVAFRPRSENDETRKTPLATRLF